MMTARQVLLGAVVAIALVALSGLYLVWVWDQPTEPGPDHPMLRDGGVR